MPVTFEEHISYVRDDDIQPPVFAKLEQTRQGQHSVPHNIQTSRKKHNL